MKMNKENVIKENENACICEGYMGATAWVGNKSHIHLSRKDLVKSIKSDLKEKNIKGVRIKSDGSYSSDCLHIYIKAGVEDYVSKEEFIMSYNFANMYRSGMIYKTEITEDGKKKYYRTTGFDMCEKVSLEEQEALFAYHAGCEYDRLREEEELRVFGDETVFKQEFRDKINEIRNIVLAYNFTDSKIMYDYCNTNFYDFYYVNPSEIYSAT